MSKAETLRRSAEARNEKRLEGPETSSSTAAVRQAKSLDELSTTLEPLAQALAALSDNASQVLASTALQTQQASASFEARLAAATAALERATSKAHEAAVQLNRAASRLDRNHYWMTGLSAVLTGILSAVLVSAFWVWVAPPAISVQLDPKAVAEQLKAATAPKPARSR